jgi:hypothetical protein
VGDKCTVIVTEFRPRTFFFTLMPPDEKKQQEVWEKRQAQTPTRLNACCANFRASQVTK